MPYLVNNRCQKLSQFSPGDKSFGVLSMKNRRELGFSIIELLLVVTIIGIIAALAVPHLQRGLHAAENGNMFATLRTISSTQVNFYSQNNRFGRLDEVNNSLSNSIGTVSGNEITRGKFVLSMTPVAPTDTELRQGFTVTATRNIAGEGIIYVYELTQSGEIRQVLP
jgi:prepilin-type N-terminal cleavage/methylation domain